MKVILEKKLYGYCPGLIRSFSVADDLIVTARRQKKKIYCDVPLAHNTDVMANLQKQGVELISVEDEKVNDGSYFLISAHGASDDKIAHLKKLGYEVVDATCPKVTAVQNQAVADYKNGYQIVIFGRTNHAEIRGINGLIGDSAIMVSDLESAGKVKLTQKTSIISQTTLPLDKFQTLIEVLKENNPSVEILERKTTCPIVRNRIMQTVELAKKQKVEMAVVVGSATSSNTKSLAKTLEEVCPTIMVAGEAELNKKNFLNAKSVLVVSGTSAPPEVVEKVAARLRTF